MIEIQNVSKTFVSGRTRVEALHDVNISIPDGSIFGIIGSSGAGKSTLVRCINMLERPTSGDVLVDGLNMGDLTPSQLLAARRGIAMIFQQFNLLMQRNCLANVCFPMEIAGVPKAKAAEKAKELLALVGLPDKGGAYPAQLSGGQKQRVAIARALATDPKVLLCDEATSALDPATTRQILELIREINRQTGITVVVITHQMSVVEEICDRVAILDGGRVAEQGPVSRVLSAPKSDAGKRLVFPDRTDERISVSPGRDDGDGKGDHRYGAGSQYAETLRRYLRHDAYWASGKGPVRSGEIPYFIRKRQRRGGDGRYSVTCFPRNRSKRLPSA